MRHCTEQQTVKIESNDIQQSFELMITILSKYDPWIIVS